MSNEDLKLKPHQLPKQNAWWYEEPGGITILQHVATPCGDIKTTQVKISWNTLRNALARKDK